MEQRSYETLLVDAKDGVATITLNRPDRKNAISPGLVNELIWALDDAKAADDVRVVVLTGSGEHFCVGADLSQLSGASGLANKGDFADLLLRFSSLGKPTIARVHGPALGGGVGLVAGCDFAVAGESATFGLPEIKRGLFPMMIMAVLSRVVPRRKLLPMMLLGETMSAAEALEVELVTSVAPDKLLDAEIDALARKLAAQSPTAMRMGLAAYHWQLDRKLEESVPYLRGQLVAILGTEDAREGIAAFKEKRAPKWTGR